MIQIIAGRKGFVYTTPKILCADVIDALTKTEALLAHIPEEDRVNLYFTLAHHHGAESATFPPRTKNTFDYQTVMSWDIDYCDTTKPYDYLDVVCEVLQVHREQINMICSGNGFQFHVLLKYPIRHVEFFEQNKVYYLEILRKMQARMIDLGLPGKPDPVIWDAARLMRLPCTRNISDKGEKRAERIQVSHIQTDIDLKELAGLGDIEKDNVSPKDIKRQYPRPDFDEIFKECQFVQWCATNPSLVHEPQAFDLFSLLTQMPTSAKIVHEDEEKDAHTLMKWVFDNATASKSLKGSNFDTKLEQSAKYGCRKCDTINTRWEVGCKSCPHFGKIVTPLALKSADHISSESNGYWVLNDKGKRIYPHYEDLVKVYRFDNHYVATPDERILSFKKDKYAATAPLQIKGWLERKLVPTEEIREAHRVEFVKKLQAQGIVSEDSLKVLFEDSVVGKLNCRNGVLNIMTNELLPHDPKYGFKYVLPYDYETDASSEYFMDWLEIITKHRAELMESILDIMAYALWPKYDDHIIVVLSGGGRNGKSTLIDTLRAVVGPNNFSSINMMQLAQNRFAPAGLEGKLVNLCEEAGSGTLTGSEVEVLKNLSAGGTLSVERKGQQGYDMKNKAKMIFAANDPPKLPPNDLALKRRLLVIPFDRRFSEEEVDPRVGERLQTEEVPKILSMLARRIKDNVTKNGGCFRVYRGGKEASEAQARVLTHGNTAVEWAKEMLVSNLDISEESTVKTDDAYDNYKAWCISNGFDHPQNKHAFSKNVLNHALCSHSEVKVKRFGKDLRRVFTRTEFKRSEV